MTPAELLAPRYKVIGRYPGCPFAIGQILSAKRRGRNFLMKGKHNQIILDGNDMFPNIFEPVDWWMYRDTEDLPKYVKMNNYQETRRLQVVYKVAPFWDEPDEDGNVDMRGIGENFVNLIVTEEEKLRDQTPNRHGEHEKTVEVHRFSPATEEEYEADQRRINKTK